MKTKEDVIIAIDPDVDKNGVAFLEVESRKLEVTSLTFPQLLDYLQSAKAMSEQTGQTYKVLIEAGWLNKSHWHVNPKDSRRLASAKGNSAGRNHEVGRKIAEMCKHWEIPYELIKPLALKVGGAYLWKGKDGKITHEELAYFTGLMGRTNQEVRDATLIAWSYAKLPIRKKR